MKNLLTSILVLCVFQSMSAQKVNNSLKIHTGAEIPVGFLSEGFSTGLGLHVTDYLEISKGGSILLNVGYTGWESRIGEGYQANLLLFKIGYRGFIAQGFYFQADAAGLGIYLDKYNSGSDFTYSGGIGYLIKDKKDGGFDISSKFNRISGRSWISLHLGYQFRL